MKAQALLVRAAAVAWFVGSTAHAQAPAPPATTAPTAPSTSSAPAATEPPPVRGVWQSNDAAWLDRYTLARERLVAGDFGRARELFGELVRTATNAADQALASEFESMAATWAARDLAFVRRSDLGESQLSAKAAGERTTDEIAVLYTNAVFYGLGTGAWLAVHTEPRSPAGAILPALGFAGAAAGAVALVDVNHPLHYGVPQSIVAGMYIGLEEGLVWTLWNQARTYRRDEWEGKTVANVIWLMSTAGAVAGGVVGTVRGTTPGRASFVGSTALWTGLVGGLLVGAISSEDDKQDDRALLASAIGLNLGALAGAFAAGPVSPSIARVRFLDLGGIGGGLVFGGLYLAAADQHPTSQGIMGATAFGAAAGLGVAWFATSGMQPDRIGPGDAASPVGDSPGSSSPVTASVVPTPGGAMLAIRGML